MFKKPKAILIANLIIPLFYLVVYLLDKNNFALRYIVDEVRYNGFIWWAIQFLIMIISFCISLLSKRLLYGILYVVIFILFFLLEYHTIYGFSGV
jgi:hypothetical protein